MTKDDSENRANSNDPKIDYGDVPPCPGCGDVVQHDVTTGLYVCLDCENEWEAWELLDKSYGRVNRFRDAVHTEADLIDQQTEK